MLSLKYNVLNMPKDRYLHKQIILFHWPTLAWPWPCFVYSLSNNIVLQWFEGFFFLFFFFCFVLFFFVFWVFFFFFFFSRQKPIGAYWSRSHPAILRWHGKFPHHHYVASYRRPLSICVCTGNAMQGNYYCEEVDKSTELFLDWLGWHSHRRFSQKILASDFIRSK